MPNMGASDIAGSSQQMDAFRFMQMRPGPPVRPDLRILNTIIESENDSRYIDSPSDNEHHPTSTPLPIPSRVLRETQNVLNESPISNSDSSIVLTPTPKRHSELVRNSSQRYSGNSSEEGDENANTVLPLEMSLSAANSMPTLVLDITKMDPNDSELEVYKNAFEAESMSITANSVTGELRTVPDSTRVSDELRTVESEISKGTRISDGSSFASESTFSNFTSELSKPPKRKRKTKVDVPKTLANARERPKRAARLIIKSLSEPSLGKKMRRSK